MCWACRTRGRREHRWRPAEQETENDDHGETAGNAEGGVQQQSEAGEARAGAALPGHGLGHARCSSVVSK